MTYTPPAVGLVPPMVHALGSLSFVNPAVIAGAPSSGTWPASNLAEYISIMVPETCVIRRLWWANGSTVSASYNVDCGVYADAGYKPGVKIISTGSTAQGTASEVQFVDVTDTTLAPGQYWLALSCSSSSATFFRVNPGSDDDGLLEFTEASAVPLPATATPAEPSWGTANIAVFGFATTASP